jgi:hypothetical protein
MGDNPSREITFHAFAALAIAGQHTGPIILVFESAGGRVASDRHPHVLALIGKRLYSLAGLRRFCRCARLLRR